jgi:putative acetyltransferase
MIIREEKLDDRAAIHALIRAAFGRLAEAVVVDRLRADGDSVISLVAIDHDLTVGHVMLSKMKAPFKALGLAPLSVRPDRQRLGVGSLLVGEALTWARGGEWDAVFVFGDPGFYRRFGFDPELAIGFSSLHAGPHFMVLPLKNSLPVRTGTIEYASAFARRIQPQ